MRSYTNLRGAFRATGASLPFLSRRAHLLTTCEAGGGIPPFGQARALCEADAASAEALWTMPHLCGFAVIVPAVG